jgi:hypothetical protein
LDAVVTDTVVVHDKLLSTSLFSVRAFVDSVAYLEVLGEAVVGVVPISVRCREIFSTDFVPQLQLWYIYWVVSTQWETRIYKYRVCYTRLAQNAAIF